MYISDIYPRPRVAIAVDLSVGGLRIETDYSLRQDERFDISIAIGSRAIRCRVRVVHTLSLGDRRTMAGVKFEGMPEEEKVSLSQYISQVRKQGRP